MQQNARGNSGETPLERWTKRSKRIRSWGCAISKAMRQFRTPNHNTTVSVTSRSRRRSARTIQKPPRDSQRNLGDQPDMGFDQATTRRTLNQSRPMCRLARTIQCRTISPIPLFPALADRRGGRKLQPVRSVQCAVNNSHHETATIPRDKNKMNDVARPTRKSREKIPVFNGIQANSEIWPYIKICARHIIAKSIRCL